MVALLTLGNSAAILNHKALGPLLFLLRQKRPFAIIFISIISVLFPSAIQNVRYTPPPVAKIDIPSPPKKVNPFPVSKRLKPRVDFWNKVFTRYTTSQIIIHDNRYPEVIYEVINTEGGFFFKKKSPREIEKKAKKEYKRVLTKMAGRWDTPHKMNPMERRIYALFKDIPEIPGLKKRDAKDRLRAQRGQADRVRSGIARSGRHLTTMKAIFKEHGLPEELVHLTIVESSFNPFAVSHAGAAGLWQFMPSTGRHYGLKLNHLIDERRDPILATKAAARLLKDNYNRIQSWPLAITAYNHGLWGMKKASKQTKSHEIEDIIDTYKSRSFGFASRNFYAEFLAAREVCVNSSKYFGKIIPEKEEKHYQVKIPQAVSVKSLVKYCALSQDTIEKLNPALLPAVFKKGGLIPPGCRLNLPASQKELFNKAYAAIPSSLKFKSFRLTIKHRVRKNQTLGIIAKRYSTTVKQIKRANGIKNANKIRVGSVLKIPGTFAGKKIAKASPSRKNPRNKKNKPGKM